MLYPFDLFAIALNLFTSILYEYYHVVHGRKHDPKPQVFDAENRLVSVTVNNETTEFLYNGDGQMVRKTNPDDSYVLYIGSVYEVEKNSGGTVVHTTVYYPAGGAVRVDGTLYYVLGDQLGSASLTLSSAGSYLAARRCDHPYRLTQPALQGYTSGCRGTLPEI